MMKVISDLLSGAAQDDKIMGQMASEEADREKKDKAYDSLESQFDQMAADGYIDQKDVKQLIAQFKAQGLDTTALQRLSDSMKGTDRVAVGNDLRDAISQEISDAKSKAADPDFNFKAEWLTADYNQRIDLVATINKTENDKYMTAIKNLVA